nr:unnamed protein product [Callosobruchus analis]
MSYNLTLLNLNIRSLFPSLTTLSAYLTKNEIDIVMLCETWLDASINSDLLNISSYNIIRADRDGRGGGVAVYIKRNYSYKTILSKVSPCLEQLWISIKINKRTYSFAVVYRPPSASVVDCINELDISISTILPVSDSLLIAGDLNINILDKNRPTILLVNLLESYDLKQLVNTPTRISNTSQTLIDVIIVSNPDEINMVDSFDMLGVSDHLAIICEFRFLSHCRRPRFKQFRDFRNFDLQLFYRDLMDINWNQIYLLSNIDEIITFFNNALLVVFNFHAPIRTIRVTKPPAPWMTYNIRCMIALRNSAYTKFKKSRKSSDWESYKQLRNIVNVAVIREKQCYLNYVLKNKAPRQMWSSLRSLEVLRKKDTSVLPAHLSDIDAINKSFIDTMVVEKTEGQRALLDKYAPSNTLSSFYFSAVSEDTVKEYLYKIKSNAIGSDAISVRMLALVEGCLLKYITYIINFCISRNVFPAAWKHAIVLPLPKCYNPCNLSDIRPISILPAFSKVLEMALKCQITHFIEEHDILTSAQSGFRAQHSTTTALLSVTDDIYRNIDEGKVVCLTMLDYSKAFDTLDHDILYKKLRYYNFSSCAANLIRSYLSDRCQSVLAEGCYSKILPKTYGVPQGSILGPILFAIYISDFCKCVKYSSIHHYADDTQIYSSFSINDLRTAEYRMNSDLKALFDVSAAHNLLLNPNKSVVMFFGSKAKRSTAKDNINIKIDGKQICVTTEAKNLGLQIDENLRFTHHVNYLCQISYGSLRQLYPSRHLLPVNIKLKLCESLILSRVSYCDSVYGPALKIVDANRVQRIQNSCLRFTWGVKKYEHITASFEQSGWMKLDVMRKLHLATLVHKVIACRAPTYLFKKLTPLSTRIQRRRKHCLLIPRHTTAIFVRSFSYCASKLYNSLPDSFKEMTLINFKKRLKDHLTN